MARRLTRRQAWRVQKIQDERLDRLQRKTQYGEDLLQCGQLGPEQIGRVVTNHGANLEVAAVSGRVYHCYPRQHLDLPVSGDRVVWQETGDGRGVVVAVMPRTSRVARPDPQGVMRPIAANVDQLVIVIAPEPVLNEGLLDRYLVAAETLEIPPILLLNKADLLVGEMGSRVRQRLVTYQALGYPLWEATTRCPEGLDELLEQLRDRTSILVGQSGVGKSSIINHLLPERTIPVQALSAGQGRHTTTSSTLYPLPRGGDLIDSPGVREFGLWHLPLTELAWGFREFRPWLGTCRFNDCSHRQEPGCGLWQGVETGQIEEKRLLSFLRIAELATIRTSPGSN